jgi:hypothetical protein
LKVKNWTRSLINTIKKNENENSNCIILAFVTIVGSAQENKTNPQERTKRNPVVLKDSKSRAMSAEMLESVKWNAKLKEKGDAAMTKASGKNVNHQIF